jgi:hypothetical protein
MACYGVPGITLAHASRPSEHADAIQAAINMPLAEREKKIYEVDQKRLGIRKDVVRQLQESRTMIRAIEK